MWAENATKPVIYHLSVNANKVQLLSLKAHLNNNLGHNHTLFLGLIETKIKFNR